MLILLQKTLHNIYLLSLLFQTIAINSASGQIGLGLSVARPVAAEFKLALGIGLWILGWPASQVIQKEQYPAFDPFLFLRSVLISK